MNTVLQNPNKSTILKILIKSTLVFEISIIMYITSTHFKLWLVKLLLWKNWLVLISEESENLGEKENAFWCIYLSICVLDAYKQQNILTQIVQFFVIYILIYQILLHFLSQIRAQCAFVHCSIMQVISRAHGNIKALKVYCGFFG